MKRHSLPFEPSIAKPCEESWTTMEGGQRNRHCQLCDKQVHNFAAMTPREIEKLVFKNGGELCARITRREDGSLVTLEAQPRASIAAQVAVSASLALSAAGAMAQTTEQQAKPETAVLTGTVLNPDASAPVKGATIRLRASDGSVVEVKSDPSGRFQIEVPPGTYDVIIRQNDLFGTKVSAATLHTGEQRLDLIKTHFYYVQDDGTPYSGGITMGELVSVEKFRFVSAARHPIAYLKYLARKL